MVMYYILLNSLLETESNFYPQKKTESNFKQMSKYFGALYKTTARLIQNLNIILEEACLQLYLLRIKDINDPQWNCRTKSKQKNRRQHENEKKKTPLGSSHQVLQPLIWCIVGVLFISGTNRIHCLVSAEASTSVVYGIRPPPDSSLTHPVWINRWSSLGWVSLAVEAGNCPFSKHPRLVPLSSEEKMNAFQAVCLLLMS